MEGIKCQLLFDWCGHKQGEIIDLPDPHAQDLRRRNLVKFVLANDLLKMEEDKKKKKKLQRRLQRPNKDKMIRSSVDK